MGVACLEFRGENFRGWRKNREIRESFLPQKFPAIRYQLDDSGYCCLLTLVSVGHAATMFVATRIIMDLPYHRRH